MAYIGETAILLEPVGIPNLGEQRLNEAADELDATRKRLSDLVEAGTGYSQQTVDNAR